MSVYREPLQHQAILCSTTCPSTLSHCSFLYFDKHSFSLCHMYIAITPFQHPDYSCLLILSWTDYSVSSKLSHTCSTICDLNSHHLASSRDAWLCLLRYIHLTLLAFLSSILHIYHVLLVLCSLSKHVAFLQIPWLKGIYLPFHSLPPTSVVHGLHWNGHWSQSVSIWSYASCLISTAERHWRG